MKQTFSKTVEPFMKDSEAQSEASINFSPIIIRPNITSGETETVFFNGEENLDKSAAIKIFSAEKNENEEKEEKVEKEKTEEKVEKQEKEETEEKEGENKEKTDSNSENSNDSELTLETGNDIVIEGTTDRVESASFDEITEESVPKHKSEEGDDKIENGVLVNAEV
jgi:hypothetical protein